MGSNNWRWITADLDPDKVHKLTAVLGLHRLTASRLVELGYHTPEAAALFLHGTTGHLADPFSMSGIPEAVDRLAAAACRGETVLVYGDYDADGITATALLVQVLRSLGLDPVYRLPSRLEEGYGLHAGILEEFAQAGGSLVVTVDCGSNDFAAMARARELGLDLIVTDHHQVLPGKREAAAFVNPRQPGCAYPDKELAGVGVAYTLVRALAERLNPAPDICGDCLDLVALGTVADVVPLSGENRILVRHGLHRLAGRPRPGLLALANRSGLDLSAAITARQASFALVPRLNAPGRLGHAGPALELLLTGCPLEADRLAAELDSANRRRQQAETAILETAREMAAGRSHDPGLVLWHEDWHPGVVGIVAGRLAEELARPVVLVSLYGGEARGSGRSVDGYDLLSCLDRCAPWLLRFGGHREAAGVTVDPSRLEEFREAFCQSLAGTGETTRKPPVATACAQLEELSLDLVQEIRQLEPFGPGNPEPVFLATGVEVISSRLVGNLGNHLRLLLRQGSREASAIYFGAGDNGKGTLSPGEVVGCAFILRENVWKERSSLSLQIRDLHRLNEGEQAGVIDRRGLGNRDGYLMRLAAGKRVLVWTNTRAAAAALSLRLPGATISHLGRPGPSGDYGALVFYQLPYHRGAVENLLASFRTGLPPVHLLYGPDDLELNEKIFAAGIPDGDLVARLAACLRECPQASPDYLQSRLAVPLTGKALERARQILRELDGNRYPVASGLAGSRTFGEGQKLLSGFRCYQHFLLTASAVELWGYFQKQASPPEETA